MRAILDLAEHHGQGPLQTKLIASHQEISVKYLEQLMAVLRSAGLVRSIRGSKGGYVLAKPPGEIRLSDIFYAFEGPIATVECVENTDYCDRVADCMSRDIWTEVQQAVTAVLDKNTLQDVLDRARTKIRQDYQI
jgi:Rrf2 family protein